MQSITDFFRQFGVDANTTATLLISILTFALGFLITWFGGQIKKYFERKHYRASMLQILKDFSEACKKQNKVVSNSLDTASLTHGKDFIISFVPVGTLDYLNRIDWVEFIKNFKEPIFQCGSTINYAKALSKLIELVAHIKILNIKIEENRKMLFSAYQRAEIKFQENVDALRKFNDLLALKYTSNPSPELIIEKYDKKYFGVFNKWVEDGLKTEPINLQHGIVKPILALNQAFVGLPETFETNNFALSADVAFMNIEKVDRGLTESLEAYSRSHRRAYRITNVIVKILE